MKTHIYNVNNCTWALNYKCLVINAKKIITVVCNLCFVVCAMKTSEICSKQNSTNSDDSKAKSLMQSMTDLNVIFDVNV